MYFSMVSGQAGLRRILLWGGLFTDCKIISYLYRSAKVRCRKAVERSYMPRKKREWVKGGIYHIITRGNRHQDLFKCDADFEIFLGFMEKAHYRYGFDIMVYCLMTNHVHLLLRMGDEVLSDAMKEVLSLYAMNFNTRYSYDGHLFQGRFSCSTVDTDSYLLSASRYIHMNPVKARMTYEPGLYMHSSYNAYIGKVECPDFLETRTILSMFPDGADGYREFVTSKGTGKIDMQVEKDSRGA